MVIKEFLDSDRVNFLIWRYLIEGNYRETAAKLQKEWHVNAPHRDFAFAPYVKGHALIEVLNRGLLYYGIEREHAQKQLGQDTAEATEEDALQVGIFGPLHAQSQAGQRGPTPAKVEEVEDDDTVIEEPELEESRKRLPQPAQDDPPAKKPRLANGIDPASTAAANAHATPMDIDQPMDNHAYPSPSGEADHAPSPPPRTQGPDQGTQSEKVEELLPHTSFVNLVEEDAAAPGLDAAATAAALPTPVAEAAPILLQCEWNPKDPSCLAAAGTDALARIWTISQAPGSDPRQHHVSQASESLADTSSLGRSTTVTAMTWSSEGDKIALAIDTGAEAKVKVVSRSNEMIRDFEAIHAPIIKLAWNPSNTILLTLSPLPTTPAGTGAFIAVHEVESGESLGYNLEGHDIAESPLDAAWTSDSDLLICGGETLLALRCSAEGLTLNRKFETKPEDSFRQVLFDWRSKLAATSGDGGNLDFWDELGRRREVSAHQGPITAMAWQPLDPTQPAPDDERLIATGGEDCAIQIWNARQPDSQSKWIQTMDGPIVGLAFTPDGAFIAGATASQVLIWRVGKQTSPRAVWTRPSTAGWMSPKTASDADEEDEHCLVWDASGQKLAFGASNKLAVISFTR